MTILPNPYEGCDSGKLGSPFYEALRIMAGQLVTCADMLFSGHTVNLTVCALSWHYYSRTAPLFFFSSTDPRSNGCFASCQRNGELLTKIYLLVLRSIVWVVVCVGYYLIIATHLHYTDDVVVGLYLTLLLWFWYFRCLKASHARENITDKIMFWLEQDAPDYDVRLGSEKEIQGLFDLSCCSVSYRPT
jgi:hypothetical protein